MDVKVLQWKLLKRVFDLYNLNYNTTENILTKEKVYAKFRFMNKLIRSYSLYNNTL